MREIRSYGSVRGVVGDRYPYRDSLNAAVVIGRPMTMPVRSLNAFGESTNSGWMSLISRPA